MREGKFLIDITSNLKNNCGYENFTAKGWKILKATFSSFFVDKGLKLSASLAFTTIFSLGPMLLLIMSLASIFFGQDAIEGKIFSQVNGLLGAEAAKQIQDIIKNIQFSGKTNFALIVGVVILKVIHVIIILHKLNVFHPIIMWVSVLIIFISVTKYTTTAKITQIIIL